MVNMKKIKEMAVKVKPFWKSKSIGLGLVIILTGALEYYQKLTVNPLTLCVIGGLVLYLRTITTTKLTVRLKTSKKTV